MTGVTRSQAHFGRHAGSVAAAKHQNAKKRDRTALGAGTNREFFSCLKWEVCTPTPRWFWAVTQGMSSCRAKMAGQSPAVGTL